MSGEHVGSAGNARRLLPPVLALLLALDLFFLVASPFVFGETRLDLAGASRRHVTGFQNVAVFSRFLLARIPGDAVLLEDGVPLARPIVEHRLIASEGHGRYSPWAGHTVNWSSSDGTDPLTNGRRYELVYVPDVVHSLPVVGLFALTAALVLVLALRGLVDLAAPSPLRLRLALALVVGLAFGANCWKEWDRLFVAIDTGSYLERSPTRTFLYPAFLSFFDREPDRPASELEPFLEFRARTIPGHRLIGAVRAQRVLTALSLAVLAFSLSEVASAWLVGLMLWLAVLVDPHLGNDADASVAFNMAALMTEGLNQPLLYLFLAAILSYLLRPTWARGLVISLLLSVLMLLRPANAALVSILGVVGLFHLLRKDGLKRAVTRSLVLGLVFVAPLLAECERNRVEHGRFKLHAFTGPNMICVSLQNATLDDLQAFEDPKEREFLRVCLVDFADKHMKDVRGPDGLDYVNANLWQTAMPAIRKVFVLPAERWQAAWFVDDFLGRVGRRLISLHKREYAGLVLFHLERTLALSHLIALVCAVLALRRYLRGRAPEHLFVALIGVLPLIAIAPACIINFPLERYRSQFWLVEILTLPFLLSVLAGRRDRLPTPMATSLDGVRQDEWAEQWTILGKDEDQPRELILEWLAPHGFEIFEGARVLDAGCGGGHQAALVAEVAREVVALDLNMSETCRRRLARFPNVKPVDGDLVKVGPEVTGGDFDVVYSIGVLQHTYDPDQGFANLVRHVKPGGRIVVWVYSKEGNGVARFLVEPVRKAFLRFLPRQVVWALSWLVTLPALVAIHTIYRLPLRFLPMHEYLNRSRTLTVRKVVGNVFDKLNAPHTDFIARERIERWLAREDLGEVHLAPHLGVSWRASATKKG